MKIKQCCGKNAEVVQNQLDLLNRIIEQAEVA